MDDFRYPIALQWVHMVYTTEAQPAGEAFIQTEWEYAAFLAAMHLHHRLLMGRKPRCIHFF
ncbi:hypothetical protein HPB48_013793 [Haemaphysalis longicornis]|uniref:Uncharacterized protein n=1 Tax=Haemaphysalis longicornis TaxID=44386 RepID=A0A9J6GYM0_HAELO|nr:hypothetical protein HPB48_013793 [Haemaphysalis longicornis]